MYTAVPLSTAAMLTAELQEIQALQTHAAVSSAAPAAAAPVAASTNVVQASPSTQASSASTAATAAAHDAAIDQITLAPPANALPTVAVATPPISVSASLTGPSFTPTAASSTQVNLTWNAVPGASSYKIEWGVGGNMPNTATVPAGTTSYQIPNLAPGTSYKCNVGVTNSAGFAWGTPSGKTVSTLALPTGPSFTPTAASSTQINLTWNAVPGATSYQIDRYVNGQWQQPITVPAGTTSYQVSNLAPNTSYTFNVGVSTAAGFAWGTPAGKSVSTLAAPTGPSFTPTAASSTQINLTWNAVPGRPVTKSIRSSVASGNSPSRFLPGRRVIRSPA